MTRLALFVFVLSCGLLPGCGDSGPKRFRFSGTVALDGKPIPYGEIVLTPDGTKKNTGPQGIAPIVDGKFDTSSGTGQGIAGGPTVVRVNGMTGPGGKTLCEYEIALDLPRTDSTKDIDVPKKDANNANKQGKKNAPEI